LTWFGTAAGPTPESSNNNHFLSNQINVSNDNNYYCPTTARIQQLQIMVVHKNTNNNITANSRKYLTG
jgi:hypothetical protein